VKLSVMRHAWAGPPSADPKVERERPLLKEGRDTALAMAKALDSLDEYPNVIFCSPFIRAADTADILGKYFGVQVNVIGGFAPYRPLEGEIRNLVEHDDLKRVWTVLHVDNSTVAMNTLGGDVDWDDLVMAEYRRVKIDRDDGSWKLKLVLRPSDIGRPDHKS
jgi:phosphohistidine phosphatase SixA